MTTFDSKKHHRRSTRLQGYDYSSEGGYFITICTQERRCLFGSIEDEKMKLNEVGKIVQNAWLETKILRPNIILDEFVVMPNHFHAIIIICRGVLHTPSPPSSSPSSPQHTSTKIQSPSQTIGSIVRGFKGATHKRINEFWKTPGLSVWQRGYYEHVIRSDRDLHYIREYILNNPLQWALDENNPNFITP